MVNNWKPILAALTIFAAGFVTGGLSMRGYRDVPKNERTSGEGRRGPRFGPSKDGHLRDLCGRLQNELRLTPLQRERIEEIVRLAHERVRVVADKMGPLIHSEFKQMEQDILKELNAEQAEKFQAIIRERESNFRRGESPPFPSSDSRPTVEEPQP